MKQEPSTLSDYLRSARQRLGVSLREVENATGVSNAYLSQLEGGKIKSPSPALLQKLSDYLKLSYADVLELAGHPVPRKAKREDGQMLLASRVGSITSEEAELLANYLTFVRSRGKQ
jgi:HTH-type transcriptional regulator, competence development regulator